MSPSAWPGQNEGYRSGWRASLISRSIIEDMFSAHDKIVTRFVWRGTHTGSYAGIEATGKRVQVPGFASWRFEDGKVVEISTIQDQFALLKQAGYLSGDVCAA